MHHVGCMAALNLLSFLPSIGKSFINQHHRDILFNGIEEMTGFADQTIPCSIQENISLTFRTG
jgi:hypothetical protein